MPVETVENEFDGARKVTCTEAAELLKQDKIRKAFFRPDRFISKFNPGDDDCYVWFKDDQKK